MLVADGLKDLGARLHHNIGCASDLIDQIFRHGGGKSFAAHQHGYFGGIFGEVEGSLAGGVGAADDKDLFVLAGQRLDQRGAIVDAAAGEAVGAGNIELAVLDAGSEKDAMAGDLTAVGKLDKAVLAVDAHAGGALGDKLGAEARGLGVGAAAKVSAGDAGRKAEVVLDAGAGAGLPAGSFRLDDNGAEAFTGAIDGGGEAGRTGADDDDVVEILGGLNAEADAGRRASRDRGRQGQRRRRRGRREVSAGSSLTVLEERERFRAGGDIEPAVRNVVAREEVAQAVIVERPAMADDAQAFERRAGSQPASLQGGR